MVKRRHAATEGVFMAKTAIVTDSNSGITQKEGKELGIFVLPMPFLIDNASYFEDIDLTQEEFYVRLSGDSNVSHLPAQHRGRFRALERHSQKYDELVHIPMSSGLSQSCARRRRSQDFGGKVHVVNNQRISITQKESVFDALKLLEKGKTGREIKEYLEKTRFDSSIYISLDTMKYLKKGGRVTPAAAAIGSILKIKPCFKYKAKS